MLFVTNDGLKSENQAVQRANDAVAKGLINLALSITCCRHTVPPELSALTAVEEQLIALVLPILSIAYKKGGRYNYKGHVVNILQDPESVATTLPRLPKDIRYVIVQKRGSSGTLAEAKVRREVVERALRWLKENNPLYSHIEIDASALAALPSSTENSEPDELRTMFTTTEPNVEEQYLLSSAVLEEQELVNVNKKKQNAVLAWPEEQGRASEFTTAKIAAMDFPTLFPDGTGDPTDPTRLDDSMTEGEKFKHLMKFADIGEDGKFNYRFASHPTFPYWCLNRLQRHRSIEAAKTYMAKSANEEDMSRDQFLQMLKGDNAEKLCNRLLYHAGNVTGSPGFWKTKSAELNAACQQKECPTVFLTLSCAVKDSPDFWQFV